MKLPMPWVYLLAAANIGVAFADNGVDAYRQGNYAEAATQLTDASGKDPVIEYYMGRMRLYGYGQLKNNTLAMRHFQKAAEQGYLPAQRIMARFALLEDHNPEQALYWFKKSAEQNDSQSQMYCAAAYMFGVGVKPNSDIAKRYYIAAARNGDSIAQCTLAQNFLETHHSANQKLGLLWLNKAVEQKNPEAQVILGQLYAKGTAVGKDINKARELVGLAVAQGYAPAMYEMGEIAQQENDLKLAKEWYEKAANSKYAPAEMALSKLYLSEKSPFYNAQTGFLWMLKAAQNNVRDAQIALSDMYKKGNGVEIDENLAKEWQEKAAQSARITPNSAEVNASLWLSNGKATSLADTRYRLHGIFSAWNNAAALKQNSYNQPPQMDVITRESMFKPQFAMVKPNQIAISEYLNALVSTMGELPQDKLLFPRYAVEPIAANQKDTIVQKLENEAILGDSSSQFTLAQRYEHGIDTKQNIDDAIKYYELAIAQQDLRAEYNLGVLYLEGITTQADYKKGMDLLVDAAFKGNPYAQYVLARIYEQGYHDASGNEVIKADREQAMSMYGLAAANNYGLAQYRLAEILVRDKSADLSVSEKQQRNQMIKELYQGAVADGVESAALSLAFFNAMDSDKTKQQQAFAVATKEAEAGSAEAALLLGLMYDNGISVAASQSDALHWYDKASANPIGAFAMGTYMAQGSGTGENVEKGQALLQKAADAGFSYANLNLAIMQQQQGAAFLPALEKAVSLGNSRAGLLLADYYLSLANSPEQMKQAKAIYQRFAEQGDKIGQLKLAYMNEKGLGAEANMAEAQKWYTLAAEQDEPIAQYLLGNFYQLGLLDKQPDYAQAKNWYSRAQSKYIPGAVALGFISETVDDDYKDALEAYQRASAAGDPTGLFNEGLVYEQGKRYPVDLAKASQLYLKAAERGHIQAMVQLAGIYLNGSSNQKDALVWYKKAADLGDRNALYQLGLLSETGVATKLDYADAMNYYEQASNKGNLSAKLALARMYQYGLGVTKDPQKAREIYKELAARDNAYAQYQLAMSYVDGASNQQMPAEGIKLLQQAQENGSLQARKALQLYSSQTQDKISFIEPVQIIKITGDANEPADLMYLDALNTWNHGDESYSRAILARILNQYPDYIPAKKAYEQLDKGISLLSMK